MSMAERTILWSRLNLDPLRFSRMSPKIAAVLRYLCDQTPSSSQDIVEMEVSYDGFVLARHFGDVRFSSVLGCLNEMRDTLQQLVDDARLSGEELSLFSAIFRAKVGRSLHDDPT